MKRLPEETKRILREHYPGLNLDEIEIKENTLVGDFFAKFFGAAAVTIGKKIYLTKHSYFSWKKPAHFQGVALLIHELKHIEQEREMGTAKFFAKYIVDWIASGFRHGEELPLEEPAFQAEREFLMKKAI